MVLKPPLQKFCGAKLELCPVAMKIVYCEAKIDTNIGIKERRRKKERERKTKRKKYTRFIVSLISHHLSPETPHKLKEVTVDMRHIQYQGETHPLVLAFHLVLGKFQI